MRASRERLQREDADGPLRTHASSRVAVERARRGASLRSRRTANELLEGFGFGWGFWRRLGFGSGVRRTAKELLEGRAAVAVMLAVFSNAGKETSRDIGRGRLRVRLNEHERHEDVMAPVRGAPPSNREWRRRSGEGGAKPLKPLGRGGQRAACIYGV